MGVTSDKVLNHSRHVLACVFLYNALDKKGVDVPFVSMQSMYFLRDCACVFLYSISPRGHVCVVRRITARFSLSFLFSCSPIQVCSLMEWSAYFIHLLCVQQAVSSLICTFDRREQLRLA